ncbi:GNAT family N-acetyltransferase [Paenactinomyces guangxiensis]|uniref:GNAT family N-acetyltransferase n=1 Tax=Paenactinomyces guangxiensis TaxID=1490290 RepID=A0A7W1WNP4_9BACL|nr:GNAT family protein [Paenactinomyces guangxiensis]MBA4493166.1 GNAT family N-acetyltransferase [Paenactinomyces guangxiensis]MBH8589984.1 GNAT family N-acetyltransferase [Paenactinomyces guangxiensis]
MFKVRIDDEISLMLLQEKDAGKIFKVVDSCRNYLREWLPWVDDMKSEEDYLPVIKMWLKQFAENEGFQAAILYKNEIVGMIGFHHIDWRNSNTSIGYWLAEKFQGKGIMTRACKEMVRIAFEEYQLNRVEIRCGEKNEKSRAIPERLGFRQEGIIRDGENLYGHFHNSLVYGLTRKDIR